RHTDLRVVDPPVAALFERPEEPNARPHGAQSSLDRLVRAARLPALRGAETGAREISEIFGVGAGAKTHPNTRVFALELVVEGRQKVLVDRGFQHVRAERSE